MFVSLLTDNVFSCGALKDCLMEESLPINPGAEDCVGTFKTPCFILSWAIKAIMSAYRGLQSFGLVLTEFKSGNDYHGGRRRVLVEPSNE